MTKGKRQMPVLPQGEKRYLEEIAQTCLLDDEFMKVFFALDGDRDHGCRAITLILRILTGKTDLEISSLHIQEELYSPGGHDIRMDVRAFDIFENQYNLEVQRKGTVLEILMRSNYNLGMMTVRALPHGESFVNTRERYVIFVCEHDICGDGLPVHIFPPKIQIGEKTYDLGGYIIIANASYKGDDEFGRLMHDFRCTDVNRMHEGPLKEIAVRLKHPKWNEENPMSGIFEVVEERGRQEGRLAGRQEGRQEGRLEGRIEGRMEAKAEDHHKMAGMIRAVMAANNWSAERTLQFFKFSKEESQSLMALL